MITRTVSKAKPSILAASCALLLAAPFAHADLQWDPVQTAMSPSGGDGIWDTTTPYWSDGIMTDFTWDSGLATFGGTAGVVTINNNASGVSATGLTFNTGGYFVGSQTATDILTLTGTAPTITVNGAATDTATINSVITMAAGTNLTKTGNGNLILTGANTYTGKTIITGGTLTISAENNLGITPGTAVADQITLSGGTLKFSANTTLSANRGISITGGANVLDANGNSIILNDTIGGPGGAGTSLLFTSSSGTAGSFTLTTSPTVNGLPASSFTIDNNTTLNLGNNSGAGNLAGNVEPIAINAGGTLRFNRNSATAYNAAISGGGQVVIASNANQIVTLKGDDSYSGGTMLMGANAVVLGTTDTAFGTGTITINGGGTFGSGDANARVFTNNLVTNNAVTIGQTTGGTGAVTLNGNVDLSGLARTFTTNVTSAITGTISNGGLNKGGAGSLTLTGTNTYTGNTQINTGLLAVQGGIGALGASNITVGDNNGGDESISFGQTGDIWVLGTTVDRIGDSSSLTFNGRVSATYAGPTIGSTGFIETLGAITNSTGLNTFTLVPGTGADIQLNAASLSRTNLGTLFLRGDGLGTTGTGTTRLVATTAPTLVGGGGAAGTTTISIVPWIIGDSSSTGAGSSFVTNDPVNGFRPLTDSEYDSSIAGATLKRNVSTAGETVLANASINALRVTGGTTTINSGNRLLVNSGAVLFTGGATFNGNGYLDFGTTEGLVTVAGNTTTTANISSRIAGTAGMTISSTGLLTNVLNLSGDNTLIGTINVNSGTLQLGSTTALNDNIPLTVIPHEGTVVQLNGNSVTIRDLQSATGQGVFQNGASTAATLTTYLTGSQTLATAMTNGSTGALGFTLAGGTNTLTLNVANGYTGATQIRTGTLLLNGTAGAITGSSGISIQGGATLRLTNVSGNSSGARLGDSIPIAMNGGTFDFDSNASASVSETAGALTIGTGANTITVDKAASGQTSVLTFASLARNNGAVVNFNSQNNGTAIFDLGTTTQSRLVFATAPTLSNGIIGGWATIDSSASTREFAKYVTGASASVTALTAADYTTTLASGANSTQNVKITASPATLTAGTQINSLNIAQAGATSINLGTNTLRIESGGIIASGAFNSAITNGTLTAGSGSAGDLIFTVVSPTANPLAVGATIADNGASVVNVVKAGSGVLDLQNSTNTYTGKTYIDGGILRINSNSNLGAGLGSFTSDKLVLANGGTLDVTATITLDPNRGITLGGGSNIISIGSGTAGNGKTLTYNGAITSSAGESSLQFKSNVVATSGVDAGKINATLSGLNVSGSLREDAGTVTLTGAASTVGRSLQVGMDGAGTFTDNVAGGSLTVGAGINDVLEVGSNSSNVVSTTGTLNLNGLSQFTANVDKVNIGIGAVNQTGFGSVTLAVNNDITAGTSFNLAGTNGIGNDATTSTLLFGSGTNNVTTKTITIGGFKAKGSVSVAAGGTVNLSGFAANTLDLVLGSDVGSTANSSVGTFDTSGGTLNANLNNLLLGQKSGGNSAGATGTLTVTGNNNNISANAVSLGNITGNTAGTNTASGTINFGGGSFLVNNDVAMATRGDNGTNLVSSTGFLNITGGTFTIGGNITRTTTDEAHSNSFVNVAGGTLDLQSQQTGDTTAGTITASQLAFRSGAITDVASATLAATSSTNSGVAGTVGDALIMRDTTIAFPINITGATGGNVHYEAASGGQGAVIAGPVDLGAAARTFNVEDSAAASADLVVSGAITGSVPLIKAGAGTLYLNNSVDGSVQVTSGVLGGLGNIAGTVSVASGGTLAPGASVGTLSTGSVSFASGSTFQLLLAGAAPGTGYSQLNVTGNIDLNSDAGAGSNLQITLANGFTPFQNETFTLIANDGTADSISNFFASVDGQALGPNNTFTLTNNTGSYTAQLFYNGEGGAISGGNDLVLQVVPEPNAMASVIGGLGMLLGLGRFRRRA